MKPLLFALAVLSTFILLLSDACAQESRPALTLSERTDVPVELTDVHIYVDISGDIALTTVEMLFHNPNSRVLEGSLSFPLLDGQSVVRFAMDVNGKLREAVPVEKAKGQQVFEEIVRRGIDPGIVEKTEGNNYRARIYPIPAHGDKRVVIAVEENLKPLSGRATYRLPLNYPDKLKRFSLTLSALGSELKPAVTTNSVPGLVFPDWQERFTTRVDQTNFSAQGLIELEIPRAEKAAWTTEDRNGQTYFYGTLTPPASTPVGRPKPTVLTLLWDSSGSGASRLHDREKVLLERYISALGAVEVHLLPFRNAPEEIRVIKLSGGSPKLLLEAIDALPYDGATSFAAIAPDPAADSYLLFSDGLANFAGVDFPDLKRPVHTVLASVQANPSLLRSIAAKSGGEFVDLLSSSVDAAAEKLRQISPRLLKVESNALESAFLFPDPGTPTGEEFRFGGVIRAEKAAIRFQFGTASGSGVIVPIVIEKAVNRSHVAARGWARLKLESLAAHYEQNKSDISRTAQDFGIVTQGTSLIVLDRSEDYAHYNITPPDDLKAEVDAVRQREQDVLSKNRENHLETVLRRFQEKITWWKRDFPKDSPAPHRQKEKEAALRQELQSAGAAAEAYQEPALSPAAPAAADHEASPRQKRDERGAAQTRSATIALQKWTPEAGYLDHMRRVPPERAYQAYLEERPSYLRSTAFFLDVSDFFRERKDDDLALRVLSNLAEMDLENHQVLRILGYRLMQIDRPSLAVPVFAKVLEIRGEEPQSYRDLALASQAAEHYQRAADLFWEVVSRPWDSRFGDIELIALGELNSMIAQHGAGLDLSNIDPRFRENLPVDLRVVLTWDADNTDIDLWVTDPNGEKCFFSNTLTYQGGRISRDFTQGYGPEEFLLKDAKPGKYLIEANFYGNRQQIVSGATTIQLTLSTKFGTPDEKDQSVTMRLKDRAEVVKVGEFEVK